MPIASEDGAIMFERARLEAFWRNTLTPAQRAAWLAHLATTPPRDIAGRQYQLAAPTAAGQVRVTEPTLYAWAQIYATFRFRLPPLADPTAQLLPPPVIAAATATDSLLTVDVENDNAADTAQLVILYAGPPSYAGQYANAWTLRPVEWFAARSMPYTYNIAARYAARYGSPSIGSWIALRAAVIGSDNSHVIADTLTQVEVTA